MNIEHCLDNLRARYDILAEIGQGGMGRVYRARDRQLDRTVAVKIPLPSDPDSDKWGTVLARFRREGRTLARLSDPSILQIYDIGEAGGLPYIISEWIGGDPLHRIPKPWTSAQIVAIATALCGALSHAHAAGVTHRDIKPANVILRPDGTPVLIDFGIARVSGDTSVTQTGAVLGTLVYLAPELLMGHELGPPVDQYGLGCVFYELAVGRTWLEADTLHEIIRALLNKRPAPVGTLVPGFDPGVAAVIEKMIARDPAQRFPSMAEAQAAWLALADPSGAPVPLPRAPARRPLPADLLSERTDTYENNTPPSEILRSAGSGEAATREQLGDLARLTHERDGPSTDSITLGLTRRRRLFRGAIILALVGGSALIGPRLYSVISPSSPVGPMQSALSATLWDEFGGLVETALVEAKGDPLKILDRAHDAAASGQPELAILLYTEALSADPELRIDPTLLTNVTEWAILGRTEARALLLAYPSEALYDALLSHSLGAGYDERRRAIDLLNVLGQNERIDLGRVSIADLKDGPACNIRLVAVQTLRELHDRRGIPYLQEILAAPIHERFDNSCLISAARETLEVLKGAQPPPKVSGE